MLSALEPTAPITPELLAQMPQLDAFVRETLRLYPPARPPPQTLDADLAASSASAACQLPAGTLVAPEPFVAHYDASTYPNPEAFDPSRWLESRATDTSAPLIPFSTAPGAGAALCTSDLTKRSAGER